MRGGKTAPPLRNHSTVPCALETTKGGGLQTHRHTDLGCTASCQLPGQRGHQDSLKLAAVGASSPQNQQTLDSGLVHHSAV